MTSQYHRNHYESPALDRLRYERAIERLHGLGVRPTSGVILAFAVRIGGVPALLDILAEYERLTLAMIRAAGGDRFPPRPVQAVP